MNDSLLRRRTKNDDDDDDDNNNMMDQDDQKKLVENIRIENEKQQKQIEIVFRYLCQGITVLTILVIIYIERIENNNNTNIVLIPRLIHSMLVLIIHWNSPRIIVTTTEKSIMKQLSWSIWYPAIANILIVVYVLFILRRSSNNFLLLHIHQGFVISNALIVTIALYLRYEKITFQKSITELDKLKYRYKSL